MLLAAESLPGGGGVALSGSPASDLVVTIAGPRAAWPDALAAWLDDAAAARAALLADPRRLQGPLTALLVQAAGMRLAPLQPGGGFGGTGAAAPLVLSPADK